MAGAGAFAVAAARPLRADMSEHRYIRLASGSPDSRAFQTGTAIAAAISAPIGTRRCLPEQICGVPGVIGLTTTTRGPADNLRRLARLEVEAALSQTSVVAAALAGTADVGDPVAIRGLRTIAPLYPEFLHLVVLADSPIQTVRDLRGRRVSIGSDTTGGAHLAREILEAYGFKPRDVATRELDAAEAAEQLARGDIDAFFLVEGAPSPTVFELARTAEIRLIPIEADAVLAKSSRYDRAALPADAYHGVGATPTISTPALLLAHTNLSDELAYGIARVLWQVERRATPGAAVAGGLATKASLAGDAALPLHPGAERFYRDLGAPT
jgi:TRAP transporter TAXI family solute receptor